MKSKEDIIEAMRLTQQRVDLYQDMVRELIRKKQRIDIIDSYRASLDQCKSELCVFNWILDAPNNDRK